MSRHRLGGRVGRLEAEFRVPDDPSGVPRRARLAWAQLGEDGQRRLLAGILRGAWREAPPDLDTWSLDRLADALAAANERDERDERSREGTP